MTLCRAHKANPAVSSFLGTQVLFVPSPEDERARMCAHETGASGALRVNL